jgi:hypothetical protein
MKLEIEIAEEIVRSCALLAEVLGASLSEVIEHQLYWGLSRPMALDGIEFMAERFHQWIFGSKEEAEAAAERFAQAAVAANLDGKARFLYTAEARQHPDGDCWVCYVEHCAGDEWRPVVR